MDTDKILSETFGLEPEKKKTEVKIIEPEKTDIVPAVTTETNEDVLEDYHLSRNTFRDLIRKGNMAIEGINDLAKESESPRAYEVLATLMKTVADTTKDLYDLQKKTKELKKLDNNGKEVSPITVDKAVFVGSTAELLKKIKGENL